MDKVEVRLECLKIAATRAVDPTDTLARAVAFEKYVMGPVEEETNTKVPEVKRLDPKKSENSKILP